MYLNASLKMCRPTAASLRASLPQRAERETLMSLASGWWHLHSLSLPLFLTPVLTAPRTASPPFMLTYFAAHRIHPIDTCQPVLFLPHSHPLRHTRCWSFSQPRFLVFYLNLRVPILPPLHISNLAHRRNPGPKDARCALS